MRRLTHSVVVCTATLPGGASGDKARAMTVSSYTSLALSSPAPLVTFNVKAPSRTLDAVIASRRFNIHVLAANAHGARLGEVFTRGNVDGMFDELGDIGCRLEVDGTKPPLLRGEGVLSVVRCRVLGDNAATEGVLRVRDHAIVVGEVEGLALPERRDFGLAYTDRCYRGVGPAIQRHDEVRHA
jgi:flavin reductase (DIM6/NTAB) family NADH-FMN oxidoreductase RutF